MINNKLKGRYHIIKQLGGGGFSVTYTARDEHIPDQPLCVVKQLKPLNPDPYVLEVSQRLFEREAKTLYKLHHEQIPKLLAHFEDMGEFFLVQDYIDGDNLSQDELFIGKKLNESQVTKLLTEILEVLAFVHQQNIIHRDINPRNLIRRKADGKLFLIDFGAVKEIQGVGATKLGNTEATVIGTSGFMAPEQANGQPKFASDVYSVGMLAIQALTGIPPNQLPKDPQGLSVLLFAQTQVSQKLLKVIERMTSYNFSDRYPSAQEALEAVRDLNPHPKFKPGDYGKFAAIGGLAFSLAAALAIAFYYLQKPPLPNLIQYQNTACGLEIDYPETWGREEIFNRLTGEIVKFVAISNTSVSYPPQIVISATDLSANPVSLTEYVNNYKTNLKQEVGNFQIVTERDTTLANTSGYRIDFSSVDDEQNLRTIEFVTLKDFKAYTLTFIAPADRYNDLVKIVEKMVQTFDIQPQNLDTCFAPKVNK
ncbi:serine/threonine-protein kinase [Merismopedia glauca]|nr:serine/threonine-protein kinase [Merismopedia glauca]